MPAQRVWLHPRRRSFLRNNARRPVIVDKPYDFRREIGFEQAPLCTAPSFPPKTRQWHLSRQHIGGIIAGSPQAARFSPWKTSNCARTGVASIASETRSASPDYQTLKRQFGANTARRGEMHWRSAMPDSCGYRCPRKPSVRRRCSRLCKSGSNKSRDTKAPSGWNCAGLSLTMS